MKLQKMTPACMKKFKAHLQNEERSEATVAKYLHDVHCFFEFIGDASLCKQVVLDYKAMLGGRYAITSANSMLAALNSFFRFFGRHELCAKQFKLQRCAYCPEEKELTRAEYLRLLNAASRTHNERLNLIIQTICATGIRVSELRCITVESLSGGEVIVNCKGKIRKIFLVPELRKKLIRYAKNQNIVSGALFVTRRGAPLSRHSIWRMMKALCGEAGVSASKVFPHNLRHLFARTFYSIEKDIAKLADILGHTNINTTRIYIVTTGAEHRRKMENMRLIT